MGGIDKALIELAGETLLARSIAGLASQCRSLLLSTNGDVSRYATFGIPVVADKSATQEGPLAGLLAALDHVAVQGDADFVVSAPVDTPFLPGDLVGRLHAARATNDVAIAVAASGDRMHHAVALWPIAILEDMRTAFAGGARSVGRFTATRRVVRVEWPVVPSDPFFNINTTDDLATAEDIIRRGESGR